MVKLGSSQVSPVLHGPSRWTGLGAWHHQSFSQGHLAHGAGHVVVVVVGDELVLRAVQFADVGRAVSDGVELGLQGEAETVGASPFTVVP